MIIDHKIITIIAAHLSSSSCSASSLSLWVNSSFSFSKRIISWWWGWLSWWSMDNLLMIMAIMVITVRMMMVIITMIVVKIIFLPSLRSWTPPESCQCWPLSLRRGSSSSCPTPLSENGPHDGDDDDDYAYADDDDGDDNGHLEGVELLDLNLDPRDVVVVEVLHLL